MEANLAIYIKITSVFTFEIAFPLPKIYPAAVLEHVPNGDYKRLFTIPFF